MTISPISNTTSNVQWQDRDIAANAGTDPSQLLDTIGRGLAVNVLASSA